MKYFISSVVSCFRVVISHRLFLHIRIQLNTCRDYSFLFQCPLQFYSTTTLPDYGGSKKNSVFISVFLLNLFINYILIQSCSCFYVGAIENLFPFYLNYDSADYYTSLRLMLSCSVQFPSPIEFNQSVGVCRIRALRMFQFKSHSGNNSFHYYFAFAIQRQEQDEFLFFYKCCFLLKLFFSCFLLVQVEMEELKKFLDDEKKFIKLSRLNFYSENRKS